MSIWSRLVLLMHDAFIHIKMIVVENYVFFDGFWSKSIIACAFQGVCSGVQCLQFDMQFFVAFYLLG